MQQNPSNYFCTKTGNCSSVLLNQSSCDQGLQVCLSYNASDIGVIEIAPFTTQTGNIEYYIPDGQSMKFMLSNQDPSQKVWVEVVLSDSNGQKYNSTPSQLVMYSYNQNNNTFSSVPFLYSSMGRSYLHVKTTSQYFVGASGSDINILVKYGNIYSSAYIVKSFALASLLLFYFLI